ncbi:MAG: glycosyltransferase family 4 protein [Luteimonas sp.]
MKIVLFANTDWYLYNFRRSLAKTLIDLGHEVVLLSPPGEYGHRLRALGLRWHPVEMDRRGLNPLWEALTIWRIVRFMRAERPCLVHNFTVKCAVYGSLAARLAGGVRVNAIAGLGYVFSSDDALARALRPLTRAMLAFSLGGRGAGVIAQNPDDLRKLCQNGVVTSDRAWLIPSSGVNCARFDVPERKERPKSRPLRVVLAARLLKSKGIGEFAEAARILRGRGAPVEFLLAGTVDPGNPDSVAQGVVQKWVDEGLLRWLGHVEDMAGLYRECDVMALPSYYGEGLPRTLVEAAASGLALISTDMPGCRDAVIHGHTGILIPPRDAEALAVAIASLDDDRARAHSMGVAARERARLEFDERMVNARTIEVYGALAPHQR